MKKERKFEGKKVLLVEDDSGSELLMLAHFKLLGFDYVSVHNGIDYIDMVRNDKFDIIIMDIRMPLMDGFETSLHIRNMGIDTPIISLTADIGINPEKCEEYGINDYILKPFQIDNLTSKLEKLLSDEK